MVSHFELERMITKKALEIMKIKAQMHVEQIKFSTALPRPINATAYCACLYCATKHTKHECPNCGAPASKGAA